MPSPPLAPRPIRPALLLGAVAAPKPKHLSAIVDPKRVGELLRAIDGYTGQPVTRLALALSPHVFVRPGELRQAEWSEFDLEANVWRIPAARMKKRREHVVPLSRQALAILGELRGVDRRRAAGVPGDGQAVIGPCRRTRQRPRCAGWASARTK